MARASPPRVLLALSSALADRRLEIGAFLERFGFQVAIAEAGTESLAACGRSPFDAVVYDLTLTDELGLDTGSASSSSSHRSPPPWDWAATSSLRPCAGQAFRRTATTSCSRSVWLSSRHVSGDW